MDPDLQDEAASGVPAEELLERVNDEDALLVAMWDFIRTHEAPPGIATGWVGEGGGLPNAQGGREGREGAARMLASKPAGRCSPKRRCCCPSRLRC